MLVGSRITQLFERVKSRHQSRLDSFSTSIPYFMLTGRKGGDVYQRGDAMLFVCVHPHDVETILAFPEIDGDFSLTVDVLNQLVSTGKKIKLARYTNIDRDKLEMAIEQHKKSLIESISLKPEDIMDWKYPAHILDTKKVSELNGKSYSEVRNKYNKVSGSFSEMPLDHPDAIKNIRASILIWAGLTIAAGKESGHDMTEFYDTLVKHIVAFPSMFDGFVLSYEGEPAGFTIWDKQGETANALAGLSRRSIAGMSEYQTVRACERLNEDGVASYNLGGSETIALDRFKLKFCPVDSIVLNSYDVSFDTLVSLGIGKQSVMEPQNNLV